MMPLFKKRQTKSTSDASVQCESLPYPEETAGGDVVVQESSDPIKPAVFINSRKPASEASNTLHNREDMNSSQQYLVDRFDRFPFSPGHMSDKEENNTTNADVVVNESITPRQVDLTLDLHSSNTTPRIKRTDEKMWSEISIFTRSPQDALDLDDLDCHTTSTPVLNETVQSSSPNVTVNDKNFDARDTSVSSNIDAEVEDNPTLVSPEIEEDDIAAAGDALPQTQSPSQSVRANRLSNSLRRLKKKISSPNVTPKKPNKVDACLQVSLEYELHEEEMFELKETLRKAKNLIVNLRDESLNAEMRHREDLEAHDVRYDKLLERIHELERYRDDVMDGLMDAVQRQKDAEEECCYLKNALSDCQIALQHENDAVEDLRARQKKLNNELVHEYEDRQQAALESSLLLTEKGDLQDLVERQKETIKHLSLLYDDAIKSKRQYKGLYSATKMQSSATLGMLMQDMTEVLQDNKDLMDEFTKGKGNSSYQYFKKQAAKYCDMKAECNRLSHQVDLLMTQSTAQDMHIDNLEEQLSFYSGAKYVSPGPLDSSEYRPNEPQNVIPDHDLLELSSKLEKCAKKMSENTTDDKDIDTIEQRCTHEQRCVYRSDHKKKKRKSKKSKTKSDKETILTHYSWSPRGHDENSEKVVQQTATKDGISCTQSCPEAAVDKSTK